MGNIATSFNEQIALLEKRGMTIDMDPNKVKEILLDIIGLVSIGTLL